MLNYLILQVLQDQLSFGGNYHVPQPGLCSHQNQQVPEFLRKRKSWKCARHPQGLYCPKSRAVEQQIPGFNCQIHWADPAWPHTQEFPRRIPVAHPQLCPFPPINGILVYKDIQPVFIRLVSDWASTISPGNFLQWLITVTVKTHSSILIWISLPSVPNHGTSLYILFFFPSLFSFRVFYCLLFFPELVFVDYDHIVF